VAAWLINHNSAPAHGKIWQGWMARAKSVYPAIVMQSCHSYQIDYKFKYQCQLCGYVYVVVV
jgi:predicted SprT family Zn-dependent metalloprotease